MLLQDVRYAIRSLVQSRGFAATAILCLGFGIGLNTTIFSMLDGVLLKPYPYADPDRLLVLGARNQTSGANAGLSYLDMRDWKEASSTFSGMAASQGRSLTISDGGGEPERYLGAAISWDLFPLIGVSPALGRGFTPDDDRPGAGGVVLLSHQLWTGRYEADPAVIGRTIRIDAKPHVVIGVMPPRFAFPFNQRLWIPLSPLVEKDPRSARGLLAFGRLRPGVTLEQATQDSNAIAARLAADYPDTNEHISARIRVLREVFLPPDVPRVIYLMMAGVTLVLFIACSNVANLMLARATRRRRELSVRAALGAGRGRIVRQLLTESVVLGLAAVPLGIVLAKAGTRLIAAAIPADQVPYYVTWDVDARALAYTIAVAIVTALIFGLFPALQISRGNLHEALKEGSRGNSGGRSLLRSSLVVAQVALALVALVGALLFVRTFVNLGGASLGFDPAPLMTMRFAMAGEPYEQEDARLRRAVDIVQRVEALPAVQAAFASNFVPLSGGGGGGAVVIDGRPLEPGEADIAFIGVTPGFLRTMELSLLGGRDFTEAEGTSRVPVAVITRAMADRFWTGADAVGRRFRMTGGSNEPVVWFTVIGVTTDLTLYGIDPEDDRPPATAFVPYAYQQSLNTGLTVRVSGDPVSIAAAVRNEIRGADSNLPMFQARTMEEARRLSFWQFGLFGWIFGTIGIVGLLLASVGVYGVLAYSVSQRTQEIGVRVALGASARDVLRLVVGDGLRLAGIGIGLGLVLAPVGTWFARSLFYNVGPFDPWTFMAVAAFLLGVALLASYLPARRATHVDPLLALRAE